MKWTVRFTGGGVVHHCRKTHDAKVIALCGAVSPKRWNCSFQRLSARAVTCRACIRIGVSKPGPVPEKPPVADVVPMPKVLYVKPGKPVPIPRPGIVNWVVPQPDCEKCANTTGLVCPECDLAALDDLHPSSPRGKGDYDASVKATILEEKRFHADRGLKHGQLTPARDWWIMSEQFPLVRETHNPTFGLRAGGGVRRPVRSHKR